MQVVQEALANSDLLSELISALPIMTHGRNKSKSAAMVSLVFALPPSAWAGLAGKSRFVAGKTLVVGGAETGLAETCSAVSGYG